MCSDLPPVPGSYTPHLLGGTVILHCTITRLSQKVGAQESGLDLTPGPGCAQAALDLALGRASLPLDGCVRHGLCLFGGQQGAA